MQEEDYSDFRIMEGCFVSPFVRYLPGIVPNESETAYFQVVLPKKWNSSHYKPICLHLAGTGDHVSHFTIIEVVTLQKYLHLALTDSHVRNFIVIEVVTLQKCLHLAGTGDHISHFTATEVVMLQMCLYLAWTGDHISYSVVIEI